MSLAKELKISAILVAAVGLVELPLLNSVLITGLYSPAHATTLKGDISHSESQPPLDPRLRVGALFDKNEVNENGEQRLNFFETPNWLAGVWDNGAVTRTCVIDYLANTRDDSVVDTRWRNVSAKHGDLLDAHNQVWSEDKAPYVVSSETDTEYNYQQVKQSYPVENSNQRVVYKILATSIDVNKSTNRIISVTENEEFITYYPIDQNSVRWERSSKIFTPEGKARWLKICHGTMIRIRPFAVGPDQARLAKDLAIFLQHSGN